MSSYKKTDMKRNILFTNLYFNEVLHKKIIFSEMYKKTDGLNQWRTISMGAAPRRKEFVYGINEISGRSALR